MKNKLEMIAKAKNPGELSSLMNSPLVSESWGASTPGAEVAKRRSEFLQASAPFWAQEAKLWDMGYTLKETRENGISLWLEKIED